MSTRSRTVLFIVTSFWAYGELAIATEFAGRMAGTGFRPLFLVPPTHREQVRAAEQAAGIGGQQREQRTLSFRQPHRPTRTPSHLAGLRIELAAAESTPAPLAPVQFFLVLVGDVAVRKSRKPPLRGRMLEVFKHLPQTCLLLGAHNPARSHHRRLHQPSRRLAPRIWWREGPGAKSSESMRRAEQLQARASRCFLLSPHHFHRVGRMGHGRWAGWARICKTLVQTYDRARDRRAPRLGQGRRRRAPGPPQDPHRGLKARARAPAGGGANKLSHGSAAHRHEARRPDVKGRVHRLARSAGAGRAESPARMVRGGARGRGCR